MPEKGAGIGQGLFFCLAYSMLSGYGLLQTPQLAAAHIGANGYWGLILAFLLSIPLALALTRLARRYPGQSAIEFLPRLLGRPAGRILGGAYLLLISALALWSLGSVVEYIRVHSLPRTPAAVLVAMILLANLYLVRKGIEVIARLAAFLFPPSILISAANIVVSFQDFRWDHLRPALHIEPARLALGTIYLFNTFLPLGAILIFAKYLTGRRSMSRAILSAGGITAVYALLIVLATLGKYGPAMAARLTHPYLMLAQQSDIPYIFQTFGLFISVVFFVQYFTSLAGFYFTLAQGSAELLGILDYKRFALVYFPLLAILAVRLSGSIGLRARFDRVRLIGFVFLFGLAALAAAASLCKRRRVGAGDTE